MKRIFIICAVLITAGWIHAQNFGYMGAKNVIGVSGFASSGIINDAGGEVIKGMYLERTLTGRFLLFSELGTQKRNLPKFSAANARFQVADYQNGNEVKNARGTKTAGRYAATDISFGMKYFLSYTGGIAPLGAYFSLQAGRQKTQVNPEFLEGYLVNQYGDKLYNIRITEIPSFTIVSQSLQFGVGNTRIYKNRIISDLSMGIGFSLGNNTMYSFKSYSTGYYADNVPSPQDYFKANTAYLFSNSRIMWIKYKIGIVL